MSKCHEFEQALKEDKVIDQRVKNYKSQFGEANPRRGKREASEFEYLLHHYAAKFYKFGIKPGHVGGGLTIRRAMNRKNSLILRSQTPEDQRPMM